MKVLILLLVVFLGVSIILGIGSSRRNNLHLVSNLDLQRYMGEWYEIARINNRFERNMEHVKALYRMLPNGRVEIINSGVDSRTGKLRKAVGKAHAGKIAGRLRVSFFWIFYSDYDILELGNNYEWALVGGSSQKYLWILSRTPQLPQPTLDTILHLARQRGYDTSKLIFDNRQQENTDRPTNNAAVAK